jgi:hypothetical protein
MNTSRLSQPIPAQLANQLKSAAASGRCVRIQIDDQTYDLTATPAGTRAKTDIWADYDPERLRSALRRNAALSERVEPEALDELLAEIRAQRGQNNLGQSANS